MLPLGGEDALHPWGVAAGFLNVASPVWGWAGGLGFRAAAATPSGGLGCDLPTALGSQALLSWAGVSGI